MADSKDSDIKILEQESRLAKVLWAGDAVLQKFLLTNIPDEAIVKLPNLWKYLKQVLRDEKDYSPDALRLNADFSDNIQLGILEALTKKNGIPLYETYDEVRDISDLILERYYRNKLIIKLNSPIEKLIQDEVTSKEGLAEVMRVTSELSLDMRKEETDFGIGEEYSVKKLFNRIFESPEKIYPTGFNGFDELAMGFAEGDLVLLAAPSSNGKSMLMSQLAINMAELGTPTAYVSLEISPQQTWARIFANKCRIDTRKLRDISKVPEEERQRIYSFMKSWKKDLIAKKSKLYVPTSNNFTIEDSINLVTLDGCKAVFIDYINMMNLESSGNNQAEALQNATRRFKEIAKQYKCVFVLAVQMDESDGRIRYSRAMKENCDFLWTWRVPNPEETKTEPFKVDIHLEKGRSTGKTDFTLEAHFPYSRWSDINIGVETSMSSVKPKMKMPKIEQAVTEDDELAQFD